MRELKVMTLGRQLSLVHSSKNSSASFQSPAFSQALIRLLYVITLRSHPCNRVLCLNQLMKTLRLDTMPVSRDTKVIGHKCRRPRQSLPGAQSLFKSRTNRVDTYSSWSAILWASRMTPSIWQLAKAYAQQLQVRVRTSSTMLR